MIFFLTLKALNSTAKIISNIVIHKTYMHKFIENDYQVYEEKIQLTTTQIRSIECEDYFPLANNGI